VATTGLIAMAVTSPLLVLPMLGTGAIAAHHGRIERASAAIIAIVLLNFFLLLPLVIVAHYVSQLAGQWHTWSATWRPVDVFLSPSPMPFPLAVWRVDTVILIVLGLMMVPVSLGR